MDRAQMLPRRTPTASQPYGLDHGLIEVGVGEQTLELSALLLQAFEKFGLNGLWPPADFGYMPPQSCCQRC